MSHFTEKSILYAQGVRDESREDKERKKCRKNADGFARVFRLYIIYMERGSKESKVGAKCVDKGAGEREKARETQGFFRKNQENRNF